MLSEADAHAIASMIKSSSVEDRLEGIKEAQARYKELFYEGMSLTDYARSAQIVENLYNIIRDELKGAFKSLSTQDEDGEVIPKEKKEKTPKAKPPAKKKLEMPKELSIEFMAAVLGKTPEELMKKEEK